MESTSCGTVCLQMLIFLDNGVIAEQGTHKDLVKK